MLVQTIIESVSGTIRRKSAIVLANKGFTVSAVAELVGCGVSTVSRSLERIVNTGDMIFLVLVVLLFTQKHSSWS